MANLPSAFARPPVRFRTLPPHQENLFTPFFSTKTDGQGIGLTLVQEILGAHGCEFRLERLPGQSITRFTVVIR